MVGSLYTFCFITDILLLVVLVSLFRNRITVHYTLMFTSVLVANLGFMQLASASDVKMAVYANQTVYLGACFAPFFLMMCVADLSKTRVKTSLQAAMLIYAGFVFCCISTIGVYPWYYKSVALERVNGVSILVKEYGPLHNLYPAYLIIVIGLSLWMVSRSIIREKEVSNFTSFILLGLMILIVSVYFGEKILHIKMELVPIAYSLVEVGVLLLLKRISLYDISGITVDSMTESSDYGFVACDASGRYLGSNDTAKKWFSELSKMRVDKYIEIDNSEFLEQIDKWIVGSADSEVVYYERDNKYIEVRHFEKIEGNNKLIHCIYLRDDTKEHAYTQLMENYNVNLEKDVSIKTEKLRKIQNDIIISMASIVENRDNNTGGHIARTSDVINIFVNYLREKEIFKDFTEQMAHAVIKAAPLHDFGKIAIPDVILNKPGKFTDEEYEIMKTHSAKGAVIVARILRNSDDLTFKNIAINIAHYHHEKWNGQGYPEGLAGEEIPFEARMMALADVFDALVSKRVYKDSFSYDKAFSIIEESAGSHFDPNLCKLFLECRPEIEALYDSYDDE